MQFCSDNNYVRHCCNLKEEHSKHDYVSPTFRQHWQNSHLVDHRKFEGNPAVGDLYQNNQ